MKRFEIELEKRPDSSSCYNTIEARDKEEAIKKEKAQQVRMCSRYAIISAKEV